MRHVFQPHLLPFLIAYPFLFLLLTAGHLLAISPEDIRSNLVEQLGYNASELFSIKSKVMDTNVSHPLIANVYRENGFEPLWVDVRGPNRNAVILFKVLKSASEQGLDPEDYQADQIESYWHRTDSASLAKIDILLTSALHAYVSDVREGRLDPCIRDPDLFTCARDRSIDPVELTAQVFAAKDLSSFLDAQAPNTIQYRELRHVLKQYRDIENSGGWLSIPEGPLLRPGEHDPAIPLVRERLAATGDLDSEILPDDPGLYDEALEIVVKEFQHRQGLEQDGIIGVATRNAMNIPVSYKIRRILINMERLRWISRDLGPLYVLVNIAGYRLSLFNDTWQVLEMPVIVGKHYRKTPVFSSYIKYIELNPYWNIPPSIAKKDILPKLKTDPGYLSDHQIRVFDGWESDARELDPAQIHWTEITAGQMGGFSLRQDPGPKNLLGRVKFVFPNRFSVYLHDTLSHNLFQRPERTFSSGCIRLSRPVELAAYLLGGKDSGWDETSIQEVINTGQRRIVKLKTPIPIHIVYLTVSTGPEGAVYFNWDVYGRDALLDEALFEEPPGE